MARRNLRAFGVVVEAGIKWIMGLLSPAGAFIGTTPLPVVEEDIDPSDPSKKIRTERPRENSGIHEHTSMTRGGTDPTGDEHHRFPPDPQLSSGEGMPVPPQQVTDRDLRSILLNEKLAGQLNSAFVKAKSEGKEDAEIINQFAKLIMNYLELHPVGSPHQV